MIAHRHHPDIDKAQWDRLLDGCANRLWYARSWVLDIASPGWNALIDEDHGALMPLTWRSRWGIHYLHQPFGLQQLGVFAPMPEDKLHATFLHAVPARYRYWDIYLNEAMTSAPVGRTMACTEQVVDILGDPEAQRAAYSQGHRRNLRKAAPHADRITWDISAAEFAALFASTTGARYQVPKRDLTMMEALITAAVQRGEARILGLRDGGQLVAAACMVEADGRAIFLKSAVNARGQELHAMFLLVDHYLTQAHAGCTLFDLAGSNTPSVARFNTGFGARSSVYLRLLRNALPAPFRWLK